MAQENVDLDKIEVLEKCLARHLEWIRAADTKIGLVIPVATAMIGALALKVNGLSCTSPYLFFIFAAAALLAGYSLFCAALSFFPRTDGPKESYIFFGVVGSSSMQLFKDRFSTISRPQYEADLLRQCHINAVIANTKYSYVKKATLSVLAAVPFWAIALFYIP